MSTGVFSQIYIHVVFAVKGKYSLVKPTWQEELYKYITGIVTNKNQKMLAINGTQDHIHFWLECVLLVVYPIWWERWKSSNTFIKEKRFSKINFEWQEGYGAFSYSHSALDNVIKYINNQKAHHSKKSFKEEYIDFLKKFEVEYDEKYLFEWIDDWSIVCPWYI